MNQFGLGIEGLCSTRAQYNPSVSFVNPCEPLYLCQKKLDLVANSSPSNIRNFSLSGFIQITRLWNLLIIVLTQYFVAFFLVESGEGTLYFLLHPKLFILSLSSVLIAAAGYIINDYYDVKIDLINKPERVVVGRVLKRRVAMASHVVLSSIGVLLGLSLSLKIGAINLLTVGLLWLYSNQLKRMPFVGNFAVAVLTGLAVYIVDVFFNSGNLMIVAFSAFAFSFTLIREIVKDIEDLQGDSTFGCRTLPVVYGVRRTKTLVYLFSLLFLGGMCFLTYLFVGTELMVFCVGLVVPLGFITAKLRRADTVKHFNQLSNYCKVIMLLGILSMAFF